MTALELVFADVTQCECDAVVVNLFEGVRAPAGAAGAVDAACDGLISWLAADGGFTGSKGQTAVPHTPGRIRAPRVVVVGLGRREELSLDSVREATGLGVGGREGGAITGGLFIGAFAGDVPWAHIDIAGTRWTSKDQPDCPEGPTGVALRTLVTLAQRAGRLWPE